MAALPMLKVLIFGDAGVGKTSLLRSIVGDEFVERHVATFGVDFKVHQMSVDGVPVRLQIWDTAGQERFRTLTSSYYLGSHIAILAYDVSAPETAANVELWMGELRKYAPERVQIVLAGTKADLLSSENTEASWLPAVHDAARGSVELRIPPTSPPPHLLTSSKTGFNVRALFKAAVRQFFVRQLGNAYRPTLDAVSLLPRRRAFAHRIAALATQLSVTAHPAPGVTVFVALSEEDRREALSSAPPDIQRDMLVWLPSASTSKGVRSALKIKEGRAFFGTDFAAARRWLSGGLKYGLIDGGGIGSSSVEDAIVERLLKMEPLTGDRAPQGTTVRLRPWSEYASAAAVDVNTELAGASVARELAVAALSRPATNVIGRDSLHPVWAPVSHVFAVARTALRTADFSPVPFVEGGVPAGRSYDLSEATLLGEGGFGCVLRVQRASGTSPPVALKVQDVGEDEGKNRPDQDAIDSARHEFGMMYHVQHVVADAAMATPYVPRIIDSYVTGPLREVEKAAPPPQRRQPRRGQSQTPPGTGSRFTVSAPETGGGEPSMDAARALARLVVEKCGKVATEKFGAFGISVAEMPIYDLGSLDRAGQGASEGQRRAWAFQLTHGLAAMQHIAGFVHQDLKPENAFVATRTAGAKAQLLRVQWTDKQDTPSGVRMTGTRDALFADTSPTVAVHADFGVSVLSAASQYSFDGPAWKYVLGPVRRHLNGTVEFMPPVLGTFYDPTLTTASAIAAKFTGARAPGAAGDSWALGLVLLNLWMQDGDVVRRPAGAASWNTAEVIGVVPDPSALVQFAADAVIAALELPTAAKRRAKVIKDAKEIMGTNIPEEREGATYMRTFVHSLLLYRAFHDGKFPTLADKRDASDAGPYWKYAVGKQAELVSAASQWRGDGASASGEQTVYDYIAAELRENEPDAHDFVARCLEWDPAASVRFVMEGEAFGHVLFRSPDKTAGFLAVADWKGGPGPTIRPEPSAGVGRVFTLDLSTEP